MSGTIIREAQVSDFDHLVALWNQVRPQQAMTATRLAQLITVPAAYLRPGGIVAERADRVIGFGTYRWSQQLADPPVKFWIAHLVSASDQTQVQAELCAALEEKARGFGQAYAYAIVREDNTARIEIYQSRGHHEQMRSFGAQLEVQQFDARPYRGHTDRLQAAGIEIRTLRELERETADQENIRSKLFEVYRQAATEAPDVGGSHVATLEDYVNQKLMAKRTLSDAYFVAVRDGEYVGLSELFSSRSPDRYDTGTTVVKHEYRRLGIALGLKLRAIAYAQANDARIITTGFAAENRASVNLNLKLGYVCEPSWITFRKSLS